jgi:acetyltransferase-like isoleucine patch superfamily enzyme
MEYKKYKPNIFIKGALKKDKTAHIGYKTLRQDVKSKKLYLGKNAVLLSHSVIYEGSRIGDNLILGHNSIIREENSIGDDFKLWANSVVDYGCRIGDRVKIHTHVYVAQYTEIESDVFIGPGTIFANDLHPGCPFSKECIKNAPHIKKGAQIGARVVINPFVTIGENALIGSGSVVTRDIPDNCLAYGNPAKVKKDVKDIKCVTDLTDFPYRKNKR